MAIDIKKKRTIWAALAHTAHAFPDEEALVLVDTDGIEARVTFAEMVLRADCLASAFLQRGIRRGDKVALWMTNRPEWLFTYFALVSIGAVVVPINTWLKENEVKYAIAQSGSRHLVMLDRFRKLNFCEMFGTICPAWESSQTDHLFEESLPDLRSVYVMGRTAFPTEHAGRAHDLAPLLTVRPDAALLAAARQRVTPDDLAVIKYTSGSTGFPKGAMLDQWGIIANGLRHGKRLRITQKDRWFSAKPFFHASGSIWGLMTMTGNGCKLVSTEAFDPALSLQLIERERCTVNFASGTMLRDELKELEKRSYDLTSVHTLYAMDASDVSKAKDKMGFKNTFVPWGLTEAYGVVTLNGPDDSEEAQWKTHGHALEDMIIRIVQPGTLTDVPQGQTGEIIIGGTLMRGYYNKPVETAEVLDNGWLRSGDAGWLDAQGYVHYVGRIKAMIKVGGENVAAEEVEDCVRRLDGVRDCVVVGVPDDRKIEVPRAYVIANDNVTEQNLRDWCGTRLASFKVPRDFVFVKEFPLTGSGKVARSEIQKWPMQAAR